MKSELSLDVAIIDNHNILDLNTGNIYTFIPNRVGKSSGKKQYFLQFFKKANATTINKGIYNKANDAGNYLGQAYAYLIKNNIYLWEL